MGHPKENYITKFVWGKLAAIVLTTLGLIAIADQNGVLTPSGFVKTAVNGYILSSNFLLGFLDFFNFSWFQIDPVEKSAISLILILVAGVSIWFNKVRIRVHLFFWSFVAASLIFGLFIGNQTVDLLLGIFAFVIVFPLALLGLVRNKWSYSLFNILPLGPVSQIIDSLFSKKGDEETNYDKDLVLEFSGIVTMSFSLKRLSVQVTPNSDLISVKMALEYLITIASVIFIILALYAAGLISLVK